MMNKKTVRSLVNSMFKNKQAVFEKRMFHPVRDWFIGVTLFLTVVVTGGSYSALLFVEYRNIAADENVSQDPVVRYNEVLIKNMLTRYRERSEAYEAVRMPVSAFSHDGDSVPFDAQIASSTIASSTQESVVTPEDEGDEPGEIQGALIAN